MPDKNTPCNTLDNKKPTAKPLKKRLNLNSLIAIVLILAGLGVLTYPVIATQWNNHQQTKAAEEYSKLEQSTPQEVLDRAWEEAHQYNAETNKTEILDAWTQQPDTNSPEYQRYLRYLNQLADTDIMAQIAIPKIDSNLPIYHGTSDETLNKGVGHLYGTDLPVGGTDRHAVLSAHTGIPHATLWDNLTKLKKGDAFYIAVAGHKLKYEIHNIQVVEPNETEHLQRQPGQDIITLVTCTPYGLNTHRLLVTGHQVPMDPSENNVFEETGPKLQWWMWAIMGAAVVILALFIWWLWYMRKKRKAREEDGAAGAAGAGEGGADAKD